MKAQKNARKRRLSSPAENQQYMDVRRLSEHLSWGGLSWEREVVIASPFVFKAIRSL